MRPIRAPILKPPTPPVAASPSGPLGGLPPPLPQEPLAVIWTVWPWETEMPKSKPPFGVAPPTGAG